MMKQTASNLFDRVMRSADQLHAASEPEWRATTIDDETVSYPDFGIGVEGLKYKITPLTVEGEHGRDKTIGFRALGAAVLSNGTHRGIHVRKVYDKYRGDGDYTAGQGSAWLTNVRGICDEWSERIATEQFIDSMKIGAPGTGRRTTLADFALLPFELAPTVSAAMSHSLMKSAQEKQAVFGAITEEFDLPEDLYRRSISMDSMEATGEEVYAHERGVEILHSHVIVPCGMRDLEVGDLRMFAEWAGVEAVSIAKLVADCLKHGKMKPLVGTLSLNPHFAVSSIIGNMPALGSDEARKILHEMSPSGTHRTVDIRIDDKMSVGREPEVFARFPNTYMNLLDGTHTDAVTEAATTHDLSTHARFNEAYLRTNGVLTEEDMLHVSTHPENLLVKKEQLDAA